MPRKYRLLIGGIGDDAHSVGLRLLHLGFVEAGFYVVSLGIRNELADFFSKALAFDVIMISNKNGHAEFYLEDFSKLLGSLKLQDTSPKLWYLGGSLSVSETDFAIKKKFLQMGFTNVYPKPVAFQQILEDINADLSRFDIHKKDIPKAEIQLSKKIDTTSVPVLDRQWSLDELKVVRSEILTEWPTGCDLLSGCFQYEKKKIVTLDSLLWQNKRYGKHPLLQPRTGVANIDDQAALLQHLENAGSDISSVQLDAASRSKKFDKAQLGVDVSNSRSNSALNGFPLPVYKIEEVERLVCSVKAPFQLRGGGPDHRFVYELALSANISGVEGGFLCYLLPYDKLTSPVHSLSYWQYIDRLCAMHEELHNVPINREFFGVLTATLIEPSLAIVINIIQALLAAQQGVRSIAVGYAEQGNRIQDVAAIKILSESVNHYLNTFGYRDCRVTTVFHQFMAAFPQDYEKAKNLIANSAITATLAGATKIMVKTPVEAFRIPTKYDNAEALAICRRALSESTQTKLKSGAVEIEERILRMEVQQIMDVIIELGNGSIPLGAIKAVEEGILDVPWSPSIYNRNEAISIRDIDGAVRYHHFGHLPFTSEIKEFHNEKVEIRKALERDSRLFSLLEKDLSRIWKDDYKTWPLDGCYVN